MRRSISPHSRRFVTRSYYVKFHNQARPHPALDARMPDRLHWANGLPLRRSQPLGISYKYPESVQSSGDTSIPTTSTSGGAAERAEYK